MAERHVLICDDDLPHATFEHWFRDDADRRAQRREQGAFREFKVDRQICRSLTELRDAIEADTEAPHMVLIDDLLLSERTNETVPSALMAVRMIRSAFGADRPKCVLHTSGVQLNHLWTFIAMGGDNVVDKKHRPQDRMKTMWATLDGARWSLEPRVELTVTEGNGRFLPYMELAHWKFNARRDLPELTIDEADRGAIDRIENRPDRAKSRLQATLGLGHRGTHQEIVQAANEHGVAWVPLAHRHQLPETHPEHRATQFRHLTPSPPSGS